MGGNRPKHSGGDQTGSLNSFDPEAEAAMQAAANDEERDAERQVQAARRYVRYIGTSDAREISAEDWRIAGVVHKDRKTIRWDTTNGKVVDAADLGFLSEAEWENFIKADSDFEILVSEDE